jgi:hypothetical protein
MPEHQWIDVDFVPLTVAGQRRIVTGFLYWQSLLISFFG